MKTFLIAEIAQAHDGSLGLAYSYIDALRNTGIDAVKFQTHIAEAESSEYEPFRVKFSREDATRYDYWKRMEFTPEQWAGLKQHCEEAGMEFISSPFSIAAVELLENLNVNRYKIGSGELNNYLMLERIARTGKPIILSSGMSDWKELENTIAFLEPFRNHLSLLQCTTAYPTQPEQWGLQLMAEMKNRFGLPTGYSDHSSTIYAGLAAATLGAEILEFHAVFSKEMFGPDAKASLTISEIKQLVEGVRMIERSLSKPVAKDSDSSFSELKIMFGKSLATNKAVKKGTSVNIKDLESKKPGNKGIPAKDFDSILNKKWTRDMNALEFITTNDIE
jgi:N,N'-diacetyllegionaminate synthase